MWVMRNIVTHKVRSNCSVTHKEWIEMSLNHAMKGALGDIYRRGKFIPQRTKLMQRWSDFIDDMKRKHIKERVIKSV